MKAVIFDVDGTLVNRGEAFRRFCNYLIDKYAGQFPYQGTREDLIAYMVQIDANGYGGARNIIPKLGKRWELPHTVEEFITERNEIFGKLAIPFPETHEVLKVLKSKYLLGIITNGFSTVQRDKIRTARLEEYFSDIIVSGEEKFAKPDKKIFLLSCKHLGVKPSEVVYVGDHYPNDIAGAIGAKIKPIWINDNPDEHREYQGIRIKRLKELLELL